MDSGGGKRGVPVAAWDSLYSHMGHSLSINFLLLSFLSGREVRDLGELFPEPMWRSETIWSQGWTAVTIEVHVKVCIVYPANSHIEVSTPRTSGCDHIWRQSLYRGNQVKIWSLSNMNPNLR